MQGDKKFKILLDNKQDKELEKYLICSLCNELIICPIQCNTCQNFYCEMCFTFNGNKCSEKVFVNENPSSKGKLKTFDLIKSLASIFCETCKKSFKYEEFISHRNCTSNAIEIAEKKKVLLKDDRDILIQKYNKLKNDYINLLEINYKSSNNNQFDCKSSRNNKRPQINKYSNANIKEKIFCLFYNREELPKLKLVKRDPLPNSLRHQVQYEWDNCSHSKSTFVLVTECCGKTYTCFQCHDTLESHPLKKVKNIYCKACHHVQEPIKGKVCGNCNISLVYMKI